MTLTSTDQAALLSYTLLPTLTPAQAKLIKQCMPSNCWLDPHKIRWWYPVSDTGYPIEGAVRYDQPVRAAKVLPPKAVRQPSPLSIESQQPWVLEGLSRATWYNRKTAAPLLNPILSQLPEWMNRTEGLKLYTHLASLAGSHNLEISGLWARVCAVLQQEKE